MDENTLASQMARADLARHMAVGHARMQNTDYDAKIAIIAKDMENLTGNQLDVIAAFVTAMRRRSWGLSDEAPVPDRDKSAELGPCTSWTPDGPAEAPEQAPASFNGRAHNPLPLGQDVELMGFRALVNWADKLGVPHDEDQWLDDEWPDKENELRVAVAEAMGRTGK